MQSPPTADVQGAKRSARWRWVIAFLLALLAVPGALRLHTDNSPEVFFPRDSASLEAYRDLTETFGSDRSVRLTLLGEGVWTSVGFATLDRLIAEAESLDGVAVVDPRDWYSAAGSSPQDLREFAINGLPHHLGLVDAAGAGLSIAFELPHGSLVERQRAVDAIELLVANAGDLGPDISLHSSGLPVLDRALDRSSQEILAVYFPLLIVSAALLLALALRRRREVVATLVYVGFCLLVTLGGMGWMGVRLNLVVAVLPPVLFAIAMATAVHLLVRFRLRRGEGRSVADAARVAVEEKRWAILWAGATTVVGFASLATAGAGPVRTLGLASAAGIVVLTVAALTLLPDLLCLAPGTPEASGVSSTADHSEGSAKADNPFDRRVGAMGQRWAEMAIRHRRWVVGSLLVSGLVAGAGWSGLRIEGNALTYLAPGHPVRRSIEELEARGTGSGSLELILGDSPCRDDERFDRSARLAGLADATARLRRERLVLAVAGPAELAAAGQTALVERLGAAARYLPSPGLEEGLGAMWATTGPGVQPLARFLSRDGCRAHLSVVIGLGGLDEFDRVVAAARDSFGGEFPEVPLTVTGAYPLLLTTQRRLLGIFATSAGLSLVGIAILFLGLTRSFRRTAVALLPSVWPVVVVIGLMGWSDIPLDIATVMVAAVILGLAVDDTVHTLAGVEQLRGRGVPLSRAVTTVMGRAAPAYTLTSALLAAGFGTCAFSDFAPTARFGGLAALAMGFVLLGALVFLPALLGAASSPRGE